MYVILYGLNHCMHFTMSLLSKVKRILKKKGFFSVVNSENTHRRFYFPLSTIGVEFKIIQPIEFQFSQKFFSPCLLGDWRAMQNSQVSLRISLPRKLLCQEVWDLNSKLLIIPANSAVLFLLLNVRVVTCPAVDVPPQPMY